MSPDLANTVSAYFDLDTHQGWGVLFLSIPMAVLWTFGARLSAMSAAAYLPDLGQLRLWSWRVLSTRRPTLLITAYSLALGLLTHVILDGFTHERRWGPSFFGYDEASFTLFHRQLGVAAWLQFLGHIVGSVVAVVMLWHIGRRRLVEVWYGAEIVAQVRTFQLTREQRYRFWGVVATGLVLGLIWGWNDNVVEWVLRPCVCAAAATVFVSWRYPVSATKSSKLTTE